METRITAGMKMNSKSIWDSLNWALRGKTLPTVDYIGRPAHMTQKIKKKATTTKKCLNVAQSHSLIHLIAYSILKSSELNNYKNQVTIFKYINHILYSVTCQSSATVYIHPSSQPQMQPYCFIHGRLCLERKKKKEVKDTVNVIFNIIT